MRAHKALFYIFEFGYNEEYCSTYHHVTQGHSPLRSLPYKYGMNGQTTSIHRINRLPLTQAVFIIQRLPRGIEQVKQGDIFAQNHLST